MILVFITIPFDSLILTHDYLSTPEWLTWEPPPQGFYGYLGVPSLSPRSKSVLVDFNADLSWTNMANSGAFSLKLKGWSQHLIVPYLTTPPEN